MKKIQKKRFTKLSLLIICLFLLPLIFNINISNAVIQGTGIDKINTGQLTTTATGNDTAQGGNVTKLNLTTVQSTSRWQGYYGNATGTLSLGLGSDIFYDFSSAVITAVFAGQNQTFDFTNLQAAAPGDIDTVWSYTSGADQASDIFTDTTNIQGISAPSVELEPSGSNFNSTILNDGANTLKTNFLFGVNVQKPSAACFDSSNCEYELIVPADGSEIYYFFLAIE